MLPPPALANAAPPPMTVEEFLDWPGDGHPYLHQLIDGGPVAMAPPTVEHGTIQANLAFLLGGHLRRHRPGCRVVITAGVRPAVRRRHNVRVPDPAVHCAPADRARRLLEEPVLLIEILSPSNVAETRGAPWSYTTIPSVAEILLVRSTTVAAELWRRGPDGAWPGAPAHLGPGDALDLASVGLAGAAPAGMYAGTPFAAAAD